jgi:anti-sigma factor RsiW
MRLAHLRWRRYLDAFVDGELDERVHRRVSQHFAHCTVCDDLARLTVAVKRAVARRAI